MSWTPFILAFAFFMVSHSLPLRPRIRAGLVETFGRRGFTCAYCLLSILALALVVWAVGRAPHLPLWPWAPWQRYVPLIAMALAVALTALAIGRPNPFSFGGARNGDFDPDHPGITRWTRHPQLVALALWAGGHMVPNGDLAHIALFGLFLAFALSGMRAIDRRKQRQMGAAWHDLLARSRAAPLWPTRAEIGEVLLRLALAALIYLALIWAHPLIIGVDPLP